MTSDNWLIRNFRKYVALNLAGMVFASKWVKPLIFKTLSQTGYSYKKSSLSGSFSKKKLKFTAGDLLPYLHGENIYPQFTEPVFHLLHLGENALTDESLKKMNSLFPFPVKPMESKITDGWKKLGVNDELFILVRPDNYMSIIFDTLEDERIKKFLNNYFVK